MPNRKALEDLLTNAAKIARIGSWEANLIKGTVYWSDMTKEIHETEPGFEPDLQTVIDFFKEGKSRDLITLIIGDAVENCIPWDVELQIITVKRNEKWIRFIGETDFVNSRCVRIHGSYQDIDVRKRAELALIEVLKEKNIILESIDDAFFAADKNWIVTYWNKQAERVLQTAKNEILGHNLWEVFSESVGSESYRKYHQAIETLQSVHFEDYYPTLSTWYEISAYPSANGLSVYFKDVTQRKLSENQVNKLNENLQKQAKVLAIQNAEKEKRSTELIITNNRLKEAQEKITKISNMYAFISQVNQNIVRVKDEATLFRNSCRMAVKYGKFKMAWIGIFDNTTKKISVSDHSGIPEEDIRLFSDAPWQINGPQDHVLQTGTPYINNDLQNTLEIKDWKPFATKHGIHSCVVLPITKSEIIFGTLNLYATELNFLEKEGLALLVEVTNDISFALNLFEKVKSQKETEELILKNEVQFRHTLDHLIEGIQIHDFNWKYLYVNDALVKYSSYSREELLGYTVMEKYPGVEETNLFKAMERCMNERTSEYLQTDFVFPDGTTKNFELSIQPVPEGILILSLDISEQKKMKELVAQNEKRFRALIEKSADMKTLSTREGKMIYCSPSVTKVLGYTLEDFAQKSVLDLIHPDDIAVYAEKRKKILQTPGKSFNNQNRFLHKGGNWVWCEGTLTNMLDEPGINAMVLNFRDISEKKLTELSQKESENLIQTIYAASLDAVIIIDHEGIIRKWDTKSEKLFGWKEKEMIGMKLSETIIPERYRELHNKGIKHYIKTGEGPILGKTIDIGALTKSGAELDISLSITPSQINGKTHFIGFIRDISGKKAAEQQREFDKNNLNALINNTSDLMWSVDKNFNLITSNQPFDEMGKVNFGKTIAKGGNVLSASYSPEMLSHFKGLYERAFSGEAFTETEHFEFPVELWTEISYYPIRKGDKVIGTACHSRDITERKKSEETSSRLGSIVESSRDAIISLSLEGLIVSWNHAARILYQYSPEEVLGKPYSVLFHSNQADQFAKNVERVKAGQQPGHFDLEHVLKNGKLIDVSLSISPVKDANGNLTGISTNAHDISRQKTAEAVLKQATQEAKIKRVTKVKWEFAISIVLALSLLSLSVSLDLPQKISEAIGKPQYSIVIVDDIVFVLAPLFFLVIILAIRRFRGEYKGGQEIQIALRTLTNELEMRVQERTNELSKSNEVLLNEIIERKKSEKNLKQSESRFREFFESAPESIVIIDINTMTFPKFNDNALKLLKYSGEELIKKGPAEVSPLVQPDGRATEEKARELITKAMNGEKLVFEWMLIDGNGKEIISEVRLAPLSNTDGPQVIANFADIGERKIAQAERDRLTADIVLRNKDLEQFAYIVSHNLRAPVANILGASYRLTDAGLSTEKKDMLGKGIQQSVVKLDNVIKDLNHILQVKHDIIEIKEKVRFSELVEDIKISIKNLIDRDMEIKYDFTEMDEFSTLKGYMYSIFYNLISNSIKYRQEQVHSLITIKSHRLKNKIELIFTDNGMGIDLEKRGEQVFGLYKRFHPNIEGKGTGLYMVKTQVETLGGKINIQSKVNKGTEFKIEFEI